MIEAAEIRPARTLTEDQWDRFTADHPDGWVSHCRTWCLRVDAAHGATDESLAVVDRVGVVRALVPLVRDVTRRVLVSGITEPSGPLLDQHLAAEDRTATWTMIGSAVRDLATSTRSAVVIKLPVLCRTGAREQGPDEKALAALGYATQHRDFFQLELHRDRLELWECVSPRVRTQIRAAERECRIVQADGRAQLRLLTWAYSVHAATKGQLPSVTAEDLAALRVEERSAGLQTVAMLGYAGPELLGFALAFGVGSAATLFAWGAVGGGPSGQLSKFLVWEMLMALKDRGFQSVEYGGAVLGDPRFHGLTEFYRRFGGRTHAATWAYLTTATEVADRR